MADKEDTDSTFFDLLCLASERLWSIVVEQRFVNTCPTLSYVMDLWRKMVIGYSLRECKSQYNPINTFWEYYREGEYTSDGVGMKVVGKVKYYL